MPAVSQVLRGSSVLPASTGTLIVTLGPTGSVDISRSLFMFSSYGEDNEVRAARYTLYINSFVDNGTNVEVELIRGSLAYGPKEMTVYWECVEFAVGALQSSIQRGLSFIDPTIGYADVAVSAVDPAHSFIYLASLTGEGVNAYGAQHHRSEFIDSTTVRFNSAITSLTTFYKDSYQIVEFKAADVDVTHGSVTLADEQNTATATVSLTSIANTVPLTAGSTWGYLTRQWGFIVIDSTTQITIKRGTQGFSPAATIGYQLLEFKDSTPIQKGEIDLATGPSWTASLATAVDLNYSSLLEGNIIGEQWSTHPSGEPYPETQYIITQRLESTQVIFERPSIFTSSYIIQKSYAVIEWGTAASGTTFYQTVNVGILDTVSGGEVVIHVRSANVGITDTTSTSRAYTLFRSVNVAITNAITASRIATHYRNVAVGITNTVSMVKNVKKFVYVTITDTVSKSVLVRVTKNIAISVGAAVQQAWIVPKNIAVSILDTVSVSMVKYDGVGAVRQMWRKLRIWLGL